MSFPSASLLPAELKKLIEAGKVQGLTQSTTLHHWIRFQEISFPVDTAAHTLCDALIVGLDAEWYEHDPQFVTELGIATLDPGSIRHWTMPWDVLSSLVTHHVRIKPNAHMVNSELCSGHPDKFQFGKTTFSDIEEAKEILRDSFTRFDYRGQLLPVIFVGHAVDNDTKMIKARFGLDLEELGVIVATVDTQTLAVEAGLVAEGRKIRLSDLLGKFDITEKYLHNAGNDIVCTAIAALLMGFSRLGKGNATAYEAFKRHTRSAYKITHGVPVFCTKCDSTEHAKSPVC